MLGVLRIKALRVECLIGTHLWEQTQKQILMLNIECAINLEKSVKHDRLEEALDYQRLANELTVMLKNSHFQLIESVANYVVMFLQEKYTINKGKVEVVKPGALSQADSVSILIEW